MQHLLKPSITIEFKEVQFEDDASYQPLYTQEFMKAKREEMQHVNKFNEAKKKIIPKAIPQRPMSAQAKKLQPPTPQKHKYLAKNESTQTAQISPMVSTSKSVKFGRTYVSETIPVISSNTYFSESEQRLKKQQQPSNTLEVKKLQPAHQQEQQLIIPQNQYKKPKSEQEVLQKFGILDWEDDFDDQFYIRDAHKLLSTGPSSKMLTIEKTNRENFIKQAKQNVIIKPKSTSNSEIIKLQNQKIQEKIDNIQQLRLNEILQNQLVVSQIPNEDEDYGNDFEQDVEIQNKPQNIQKSVENEKSAEEDYGDEAFEVEDENIQEQVKKEQKQIDSKESLKAQSIQAEITRQQELNKKKLKQAQTSKPKKQKNIVYRAKNAKERKQELLSLRSEVEKQLLATNEDTVKLYKQLQDTTDKEKTMIEVNTKRKEELSQAQLTLQLLKEKLEQQQQIIEDLDKKDHYAQQIIEKLKENRTKQQKQYDEEIEKYLACKVIARFLRGRKDRKLYLELKRQRFLNKIKN